jgi:lipopolysaccharide/colanic/teichoic acid biosynthesis glycosyltransferase
MYRRGLKRALDFLVALAGLVLISPILIALTIAIRFALGSPVLFRQQRPGLNEKPFDILKFRTMTSERDASGELRPDRERLTPFGAWLRRNSLDELPTLLNVFRGDMSLVGPRPLLMKYLPYYTERERLRHSVRPGITGLAQVNGRNTVNWDQRIAYDVEYVENLSFLLDCNILFRTLLRGSKDVVAVPNSIMQDLDAERAGRNPRQETEEK